MRLGSLHNSSNNLPWLRKEVLTHRHNSCVPRRKLLKDKLGFTLPPNLLLPLTLYPFLMASPLSEFHQTRPRKIIVKLKCYSQTFNILEKECSIFSQHWDRQVSTCTSCGQRLTDNYDYSLSPKAKSFPQIYGHYITVHVQNCSRGKLQTPSNELKDIYLPTRDKLLINGTFEETLPSGAKATIQFSTI